MQKLPNWVVPENFPMKFDLEATTSTEMVARLYGAMQTLIDEFNKLVDEVNETIDPLYGEANERFESFAVGLRQEFQDFIDIINLKVKSQGNIITDVVNFMKTNVAENVYNIINEMRENGQLSDAILTTFNNLNATVENLETTLENFLSENGTTVTELLDLINNETTNRVQAINEESKAREQAIENESALRKSEIEAERLLHTNAISNEEASRIKKDSELETLILKETSEREEDVSYITYKFTNDVNELRTRMDTFTALPSGSTSGYAELIDGRTDFKGTTHTNIGTHIREVSEMLESEIKNGFYTLTKSDMQIGIWELAHPDETVPVYFQNTKTLCLNKLIPVKKGDKVKYDVNDRFVRLALFRNDSKVVLESTAGWASTDGEFVFNYDGLLSVLVRKGSSDTNVADVVTIDDFTPTIKIYTSAVQRDLTKLQSSVDGVINSSELSKIYLDEIENVVKEVREKTTSKAIMLCCVTDSHYGSETKSNFKHTMTIVKKLNERLRFDAFVHLGDIFNGYVSKQVARTYLDDVVELVTSVDSKAYIANGNHDINPNADGTQTLSSIELYSHLQRFNESYVERESANGNYYIDFPSFKTRLIIFDSEYISFGFSNTTLSWLTNVLNKDDGYKVVLLTHAPTTGELTNDKSYCTNSEQMETLLHLHKDKILFYLHGHTHVDNVVYRNEFPQVSIACSELTHRLSSTTLETCENPVRVAGTLSQECFDIVLILPEENKVEFIRYGAGNNRSVSFRI